MELSLLADPKMFIRADSSLPPTSKLRLFARVIIKNF